MIKMVKGLERKPLEERWFGEKEIKRGFDSKFSNA